MVIHVQVNLSISLIYPALPFFKNFSATLGSKIYPGPLSHGLPISRTATLINQAILTVSRALLCLLYAPRRPKPNKSWKLSYERASTSDDFSDSSSTISASSLLYYDPQATREPLVQSLSKPFLRCLSLVTACLPSQRRNLEEREAKRHRKRRQLKTIGLPKAQDNLERKPPKARPNFDGFCCPQNESFYSLRPYSGLQHDQFRLLKILS
jgi:hypothetical protein